MGAFTKETFVQKLEAQGIVLSTKQLQQFETYAKLLAQWNEKINLTAIVEENEVYEKHFYDSILPFLHMDMQCLCCLLYTSAGQVWPCGDEDAGRLLSGTASDRSAFKRI